jgi:exopolysaccharide biosynthesis predicted pyruvyltransferase EpsI
MDFPNFEKINKLKTLISDTLSPLIDNDYVLLEVPNYRNIGDNLIWEGELEFLKRIPFKCLYSSNPNTFKSKNVSKDVIILLQGGGNFGDIYTETQQFRLDIIEQFPNNKIIIFPQTIYYQNNENLKEHAQILNKHNNLYICARDHVSRDLLFEYGIKERVLLLPDMAFFIDMRSHFSTVIKNKSLYMKRVDSELNLSFDEQIIFDFLNSKKAKVIEIKDWPSYSSIPILNIIIEKFDAVERRLSSLLVKIPVLNKLVSDEFGLNSNKSRVNYISQGVQFINSYDSICTTRLHGFILAVLLNRSVGILDNSYGKNSNFYNSWLSDFEKVTLIDDIKKKS